MAEHDGNPNGFFADHHHPGEQDGWREAPEELTDTATDDEFADLDEIDARYLRTLATPSFDLGPQTDSFTLDLAAAESAASRHAAPGQDQVATEVPGANSSTQASRSQLPHQAADQAADQAAAQPADRPAAAQSVARPSIAPEPAFPPPATPSTATPSFDITPAGSRPPSTTFEIPPLAVGTTTLGAESLTAATVLKHRRPRPLSGYRKVVYALTGGKINFGLSKADRRRLDLIERSRTPVGGCYRLAVISLKGGVGKTTTTAALGAMFADLRGDRVIALDANPDRGTLAERAPRESGASVRHLLAARADLHRYADVRSFTSQSPTRLEVLASDSDPHVSHAFSEDDYRDTIAILERFYNLVLTDCGTGLLHDAMRGILGLANSLVVVSSASLDGARSASATLDWLEAHGLEELAKNAVVVISSVRPGGGIVDVLQLEDHFASRCREVVTIPYDPHLESGGVLELSELDEGTADAYLELAAAVGEGFAIR
jgi:MinD-like ATPase involved in chromosome partitioning or flagellar assembly